MLLVERFRGVILSLAVAAAYVVAGKLGLSLAVVHPSATAVWAPTGIALAAFLRLGYGVWPAIFLAAFLVNVTTEGSIATSIGIALGNTLEGAVGCYLVTRFARGSPTFSRPLDVFAFIGQERQAFGVTCLCRLFAVTRAGFYAWRQRPASARQRQDRVLLEEMRAIFGGVPQASNVDDCATPSPQGGAWPVAARAGTRAASARQPYR